MTDLVSASPEELEAHQLGRLREVLAQCPENAFYAPRLRAAGVDERVESVAAFRERMPFTTKDELVRDQAASPPHGTNLSRPLEAFVRLHQTSSTTGRPLRWLDTRENWEFLKSGWGEVLAAAGTTAADRVFVAFSFGPFIGLWLAFEAAADLGALCLSGGALSSETRLQAMLANGATVLCCTPTYALRLGEVAREEGLDLAASQVHAIVVGGEPGGSVPATRSRLEELWPGARVHDHYGMTEVGPVTHQCPAQAGVVHALESHYLCEVVDRESGAPLEPDGEATGELVLTTLGRADSPALRYRTDDVVRPLPPGACACGRTSLRLAGGVLARADEMTFVRGVNLYPAAVDELVRGVAGVAEYRVLVRSERGMTEVELEIEPAASLDGKGARTALRDAVAGAFRRSYSLRVPVRLVDEGALPRFELKARRWLRV